MKTTLIWIDLEMTGLDPERDRIIEIATGHRRESEYSGRRPDHCRAPV